MSTATSTSSAFKLEDLSGRYGFKLFNLIFDLPGEKVNKFSKKVMQDMEVLLADLEKRGADGSIEALIVTSGKAGNFIAGADIEMIQACKTADEAQALSRAGQKMVDRWEDLPFPTVVAINGPALGGGCEFSLASTAIVMSTDPAARIGLPETMLGVIPGMGGCVRMPRKIGIAQSLDLILAGKALNGERAYKAGLADGLVAKENFEAGAMNWVKTNLSALKSGKRLAKEPKLGGVGGTMGALMEKTPLGRSVIYKKARESVMSKTKGKYPAVLEVIDVLQANGAGYGPKLRGATRNKAMEREAVGFGKMAATDVSKNLIRIFFMTEGVKKSKGVADGATVKPVAAKLTAVLGAGVMGGGIAQLLAEKSIPVRMKDLNSQALGIGMASAAKIFKKQLQSRRINQREYLQKMNLISPTLEFTGFKSTNVVIEAIVENMDVKKKVFKDLENSVSDDTVLASNTSSLSITEMQSVLRKPERFVGMHFFNPVAKMPLIEVIRGDKTSDTAVATIFQLSKQLGKTPIVVKDAPGFLVNRLLMPFLNEATWLLSDGVPIDEIDRALSKFGMPMGAMELIDEVGVDVGDKVAHILHNAFGARMQPSPYNDKVVKAGRLGKKNGKGMYLWEEGGRKKVLDPEIYSVLGVTPVPGTMKEDEIVDRCLLPMINEAARCLDEKIVETPAEVDLGMIMGTGFPPFRGGLLRYADAQGAAAIVEKLKKLQTKFGARYEPAAKLVAMAQNGQKFYP